MNTDRVELIHRFASRLLATIASATLLVTGCSERGAQRREPTAATNLSRSAAAASDAGVGDARAPVATPPVDSAPGAEPASRWPRPRNQNCDPAAAKPAPRPRPPAAGQTLNAALMVGPFAKLTDYCCGPLMEVNEGYSARCLLEDDLEIPMEGPARAASTHGPIKNARLISIEGLDTDCRMAIEVEAGWYVHEPGFYCGSSRSKSTWQRWVTRFEIVDLLPGGAPEVGLTYRAIQSLADYDPRKLDEDERDYLMVCGLGESGVPSCLADFIISGRDGRGLLTRYDDSGNALPHRPKIKSKFRYMVSYAADSIRVTDERGNIVIAGPVVFP